MCIECTYNVYTLYTNIYCIQSRYTVYQISTVAFWNSRIIFTKYFLNIWNFSFQNDISFCFYINTVGTYSGQNEDKNRKFVPIIQMFYEWQNESIYQVNYNKNIYCTVGEYFRYGKFTFFRIITK